MTVHGFASPYSSYQGDLLNVAVIGRGFSGMMMAIALLKTIRQPFRLRLIDPMPTVSGGQALLTARSTEILNSRARDLSVSTGEPKDFTRWLQANAPFRQAVSAAIPGFGQIFVPKSTFSDYVFQRFSEALAERKDVSVQMSSEGVASVRVTESGLFEIAFEEGDTGRFHDVILATGFGRKRAESRLEALDTFAEGGADAEHVVVLGSGLRVVDQVLQLRDGGFRGRITIVSRRGFLPQPHTRLPADAVFPNHPMPSNLRQIVRFVREACAEAEENGWSWQATMNGLRKRARTLWSSLPPSEKRQFNRHLRSIYDAHRNRLPADVHARLERELATGQTELRRGTAIETVTSGLRVRWAGETEESLFAASEVIDCRCLAPDLCEPVIADLLKGGLAVTDELDLGLAVNPAGELLGSKNRPAGLFAIGPLGLGSLPDIDLVPEIVTQTYAAASLIDARSMPQLRAG
ncbi:putative NAD(P)/FAD-binding protein YdhS [Pararhizobium capsulatum DSM 1112]|uniref:NAD(P)/FAD-binding protein YdhS n=1 Tax=Pararhizobium capsulatum DSM 1112 TaxID=1121113 RepID=A0ABU0BVY5_9HYPH|nr:FAD/NAD(P)-binding protein [Pararhizobium capsulatum]MDQ0322408.1 putative NAD(P)/FAD-binding protein YdhS [Pararhizobium capsulatum DSM 1112]